MGHDQKISKKSFFAVSGFLVPRNTQKRNKKNGPVPAPHAPPSGTGIPSRAARKGYPSFRRVVSLASIAARLSVRFAQWKTVLSCRHAAPEKWNALWNAAPRGGQGWPFIFLLKHVLIRGLLLPLADWLYVVWYTSFPSVTERSSSCYGV